MKKNKSLQLRPEFLQAMEYIASLEWSVGTPGRHLVLQTLVIAQDFYKALFDEGQNLLEMEPIELVNWYIRQSGWQ